MSHLSIYLSIYLLTFDNFVSDAISTITAPLMGSILPGQHIPGLGYAPAFWPGFYAATLALVLLVLCAMFLPETRDRRTPDDADQHKVDSVGNLVIHFFTMS